MTIGDRLREERERLGMSQPAFAEVAQTTKQTLFSWETGKTSPDGVRLALLAAAGVDVLFVLTGQRGMQPAPGPALRDGEAALLEGFRALDARGKSGVLALVAGMAPAPAPKRAAAPRKASAPSVSVTQHAAPGTTQIGQVATLHMGAAPAAPTAPATKVKR